jgi:hypothetical protein
MRSPASDSSRQINGPSGVKSAQPVDYKGKVDPMRTTKDVRNKMQETPRRRDVRTITLDFADRVSGVVTSPSGYVQRMAERRNEPNHPARIRFTDPAEDLCVKGPG